MLIYMQISLFKISSLLLLFNAFLFSSKLPDGLFTAKEVGLFFSVGLSCLFAALICFRKKHRFLLKFKIIDLLIIGCLILIPHFHFLFFKSTDLGNIAVQGAYGLAYFSLRILIADLKPIQLINAFAEVLITVFCFQLLIAIAQHSNFIPSFYPIFRATGMFFNPGPFAIFTSALIAFIYVLWLIKLLQKQYGWMVIYTLIIGIGVYFVALSLSRSAWIGLSISILLSSLVILFVNYDSFFKRNKILIGICTVILIFIVIPLGRVIYDMKVDSANGRELVWKATGLMIGDSWNKGIGIGNFAPKYIHYQAAYFNQSEANIEKYGQLAGDSRYAFNDLLHTFAENGLIGLLLFLSIVIYLFFASIRFIRLHKAKPWAILLICGGMASVTVILVAGLTAYPLQMVPIGVLFWLLVAILVSVHPSIKVYSLNLQRKLLLGVFFIFFSGLYFYYFKVKTQAYLQWAHEEKKEVKDMESLISIYPLLNTSPHYLFSIAKGYMDQEEYEIAMVYLKRAVKYSPAKEFYYALGKCYEKQGNLLDAEKTYILVQQAIPNLLKPYYLIAMMHYNKGNLKSFKIKAEEALDFEPKFNNTEVIEMKHELKQLLIQQH